ncbi:Alpha/Beta hydrolase protein [Amylostereum chailletii]|nr:Alpha/Beta hydrolase protein [Amylostereum chailletii]
MSTDYDNLPFTRPASQIKALNVDPVPERIFEAMKKYEDSGRGFNTFGFERVSDGDSGTIFVQHRPADAQVSQVYRMPVDAASSDLQRLTYFDIGSGRTIAQFLSIAGDDWRGAYRAGGTLMVMDTDGNENFQLWRYWEDKTEVFPKTESELDNSPGVGRIERLTDDNYRHRNVIVSPSNKLLAFSSTMENTKDILLYIVLLTGSNTGLKADEGVSFNLTKIAKLVTPIPPQGPETTRWLLECFSIDDRYVLATQPIGSSYRPIYIIDISHEKPKEPERLVFPGTTENPDETTYGPAAFSQDPANPHLIYAITNAYGDFNSVVTYDVQTRTVVHITTPEPSLHSLRPIPWDVYSPRVTSTALIFRANVEGWHTLYALPLSGPHKDHVVELKLDWKGGFITFGTNHRNGRPNELVLELTSYRTSVGLALVDISSVFGDAVQKDADGRLFVDLKPTHYAQAIPAPPQFKTPAPQLLKFKSFDGLEVPSIYYHPNNGKTSVPVVIGIHGGPESQATVKYKTPIHFYLLNELGCAVIYPNVRGSDGYGKRYLAADNVEKREDAVKDIGALLDHISTNMKNELDASRVAVMGGSYGGYMVFACLVHFSPKITCGVANFGVAHWPSFLRNTAAHRRSHRRREYGDETNPEELALLERISPLNHADKIEVPLLIAHGEKDSRIPVQEALTMYDIVKERVHAELMVCEKEGHGFKQKSVIEFTNAAKIRFFERFLLSKVDA